MQPPPPVPSRVEEERLRRHLDSSNRSIGTTLYPALVLWGYFFWVSHDPVCLLWAAAMHLWQGVRIHHARHRQVHHDTIQALHAAERRSALHVAVFGLLWGAAPWLMLSKGDLGQLAIMLLMLLGMMSGALGGLAYSPLAARTFLCTVGAMLAARMLVHADVTHLMLGISTGVYTSTLVILHGRHHHTLREQIELRLLAQDQAQTLAQQKAELEALHAERNHLFATASHDLRQPVQALHLQAQGMAEALASHPQALAAQRVVHITQALAQTLDSVLSLHHLEHLAEHAAPEAFPAEALLFDAAQLWQGIAARKGLSLRFHGLEATAWAPRLLVLRLLNNLMDNALKYTPHGGVLVAARVRSRAGQRWIRFEVWDTGPGIPDDEHHRVFEAYHQVPAAAGAPPVAGLGLGLSAVREVCHQRGWPLGLRSRLGRGSVFHFEVPTPPPHP